MIGALKLRRAPHADEVVSAQAMDVGGGPFWVLKYDEGKLPDRGPDGEWVAARLAAGWNALIGLNEGEIATLAPGAVAKLMARVAALEAALHGAGIQLEDGAEGPENPPIAESALG